MTEDDIKEQLLKLVRLHCTGHRPKWKQEPYRSAVFAVFQQSIPLGPSHGDFFAPFLIDNTPAKDGKDEDVIESICSAWSEWLYCYQELALGQ